MSRADLEPPADVVIDARLDALLVAGLMLAQLVVIVVVVVVKLL